MKKYTLAILFFTLMLDMIGIGMVIPIVSVIFTDPTSTSFLLGNFDQKYWFTIAGLATAAYGTVQFLAAPVLGEMSDMYGRKKLLSIGVFVLAISNILFGISILIKSLALLFVSRLIGGFAGANFSIAQATIADISTPENRAKNFGLIGAAFGIGFIVGPALGGFIAHHFGSAAAPFFFSGVLGLLNFVSVRILLEETHHENRAEIKKLTPLKAITNISNAFKDIDVSPLYTANFFYFLGFAFFTSFSGLYMVDRYKIGEAGLGTYFAAIGICIIFTQMVILRIISGKWKPENVLKYTIPAVAMAVLAVPFMPNLLAQYLLLPIIAIPQGVSMSNLGALLSLKVSKEKQGLALGINGSLGALSQGVVPTVAGVAASFVGVKSPFVFAFVTLFASWFTIINFLNKK